MLHNNVVRYSLFSLVLLILSGFALPAATQELNCAFTYTSPAGKPSLKFCVSPSGTLNDIEVPVGDEFLTQAYISGGKLNALEGYGLCNESPAQAYSNYINDYLESSNWNPPTIVSQTATSIKIAHSTSDGVWTLTQTFLPDTVTPGVKIMMALHNNTSVSRVVYLFRVTSGNGPKFPQSSSSHSRAFSWIQSRPVENFGDGVMLENASPLQFGFMNAYVYQTGVSFPPNPCDFASGASNSVMLNDTSNGFGIAFVDSIGAHKTKTATVRYRSIN